MTAAVAPCGLCQNTRVLCDSHLFPAAIYKQLRDPSSKTNQNPVVIRPGKAFTSSKQVSSYFLCGECEQRFDRYGGKYVLTQYAHSNGQFKLRDQILSVTPLEETPQCKVYDVQERLGRKVEQYLYFAASIFWRASAHRWELNGEPLKPISLGAVYQRQFREYLLNQADFPLNARIWVFISSEDPPLPVLIEPCTFRVNNVHRHKFYIPGLLFILFLGKDAPKQFDARALNGSGRRVMWLCPWTNDSLFNGFLKRRLSAKPLGKLAR